jgi:hypothetical protein
LYRLMKNRMLRAVSPEPLLSPLHQ